MIDFNSLRSINFDFIISSRLGNRAYILPMDNDTIMIILGRMEDCDLKMYLSSINLIGAKSEGLSENDLSRLIISARFSRALINAEKEDLNKDILKSVYKEIEAETEKIKVTLDILSPQKDPNVRKEQEEEFKKQSTLLIAFEDELLSIKHLIEDDKTPSYSLPVSLPISPVEETNPLNYEPTIEPMENIPADSIDKEDKLPPEFIPVIEPIETKDTFPVNIKGDIEEDVFNDEMEDPLPIITDLKELESEDTSKTLAGEVSYYERTFRFTKALPSKDCAAFSFIKEATRNKNSYFLGLTKNINKKTYDNSDESLLELTKANDLTFMFATTDFIKNDINILLEDDYEPAFCMYYDLLNNLFLKHTGTLLSLKEYSDFKTYVNTIADILSSVRYEREKREYSAYLMAKTFLLQAKIYNYKLSATPDEVAKDLLAGSKEAYLNTYRDILENHVAREESRLFILELIKQMSLFPESYDVVYPKIPQKRSHPKIDESYLLDIPVDDKNVGFKIVLLCENSTLKDKIVFSHSDILEILIKFFEYESPIKRLYLKACKKEVMLLQSVKNEEPILVITDEIRKRKELNGHLGEIIDFYYPRIKNSLHI